MAKRRTKFETFQEKLEALAATELNEHQRIRIAKKSYLMHKKDEIENAIEQGYNYQLIAKIATEELLATEVPKAFIRKNKEGEEVTVETKFVPVEIKKFIEPSEE